MQQVQTPVIPVIGQMVAQTPGTISLGQGIVHYDPPRSVAEAAADAAQDPSVHRYGQVDGLGPLQEAIGRKLAEDNRIAVTDRQRIVVTAGSNMGFLNAILAIADVGDEIVLLSPYYFNHEMAIAIAGCRAVSVATDKQYLPDPKAIEAALTDRTRAVVTISPNNPTGAVYPPQTLRQINQMCARRGLYHICDEAYEYFIYDGAEHFCPLLLPDSSAHTIGLFSLSKSFGMAGWRCGYMLIPEHLEMAVKKVQDTNLICPPLISQRVAMAALAEGRPWVRQRTEGFESVRNLVLEALAPLGDRIELPRPGGAFYALMRLRTDRNDMDLVETLIREHRVAVLPGSTFGLSEGCSLRIAYGALDHRTVAEGVGRLVRGLESLI
ncbi:MAG: pyridoxal phosphate-dependent aminotransferase [Phycisphaeraceae bacterium]|nr:pyridoxal phosphate-dependent aminotransferase [Phycisphaeraceae bacterium]